jgi:hypothetical protein
MTSKKFFFYLKGWFVERFVFKQVCRYGKKRMDVFLAKEQSKVRKKGLVFSLRANSLKP